MLTIFEMSHINRSRTNAEEQNAFLLVLSAELGNHDVQGRLGHGIQCAYLHADIVDEVEVGLSTGNCNGLFGSSLEEERGKEVEEMELADGVGLVQLQSDLLQLLGLLPSVHIFL